jgi:hypothetical protein
MLTLTLHDQGPELYAAQHATANCRMPGDCAYCMLHLENNLKTLPLQFALHLPLATGHWPPPPPLCCMLKLMKGPRLLGS